MPFKTLRTELGKHYDNDIRAPGNYIGKIPGKIEFLGSAGRERGSEGLT